MLEALPRVGTAPSSSPHIMEEVRRIALRGLPARRPLSRLLRGPGSCWKLADALGRRCPAARRPRSRERRGRHASPARDQLARALRRPHWKGRSGGKCRRISKRYWRI